MLFWFFIYDLFHCLALPWLYADFLQNVSLHTNNATPNMMNRHFKRQAYVWGGFGCLKKRNVKSDRHKLYIIARSHVANGWLLSQHVSLRMPFMVSFSICSSPPFMMTLSISRRSTYILLPKLPLTGHMSEKYPILFKVYRNFMLEPLLIIDQS